MSYEYSEDHLIEDAAAEVLEALEWQMEKLFNGFHPREDTEEIGRHLWFSAGYRPEGRPAIKMVT